ncbi:MULTISPECIES: hypothetical protein [Stenotrophomonas]|uniref:Uncharacterized protein n=1 Tax=Stenotrophomonas maltophilia TaxID=40324 RepID=A0A3S0HS33_STEMA|nr:hypothetical protein [Stenotrophomonas maltophilia]RTQ81750.1 hypothetical protein EKL94_21940 [Stenotrophomonas maltophilia]
MRISFVVVVVALLACGQAWAQGGSIPPTGIELKTVQAKAWPVATYTSEPGEAKEAFLLRIAPEVAAWTAENQAEACAFVATDGQRWGLKLITLRSQFECVFAYGVVPEGMTTTNETFHSHPPADGGGYITLTEGTKAAAAALGDASLGRVRQLRVENGGEFSERDFKAGPGYLITNGRLLFQNGRSKKNRRDVGPAG